jgi:predicted nucleotidyltransferase
MHYDNLFNKGNCKLDKNEIITKLILYKELVSKYFNVEKMYLFGSYARETQQQYSDIDVAIVVKDLKEDFFTYAPRLWKLRVEIDPRIEPVLFELGKDPSGFLEEIVRTGIEIN